ncbi:complex III assembly factor LYRM7 [Musca domestica]|uniref:Complex III assembly factor LYRM7 n=1 Tax=Musca domestica TaxID=7370 RepID=A0A9J7DDE4_MUSDO|nr:complex III assembly factor LYRM7 [Musca domestica]
MSQQIRREVLKAFRKLHRTRQLIFAGDDNALALGRNEINSHFRKNMQETNVEEIKKMVKLALDVDKELRTNVIQAKKKDEGVYELRITPETTRLDNIAFNPDAVIEPPRRRKGQPATGCCGGGGAANQAAESSNQKQ